MSESRSHSVGNFEIGWEAGALLWNLVQHLLKETGSRTDLTEESIVTIIANV
jgi:ABC-type proline/glycine betaine transport system substrate-binding protein